MAQQYKLGKLATRIIYTKHGFDIFFYNTKIVSLYRNELILDTGGWYTAATKTRMNQASNEFGLGYTVFQKNYIWYVEYKKMVYPFDQKLTLILK